VQVTIFCNKTIKEGDGSCHLLLLRYNRTIEKDDGSLPLPSLLQQNQNKKKKILCCSKTKTEGDNSFAVAVTFFVVTK
jgi:hypothetical protein